MSSPKLSHYELGDFDGSDAEGDAAAFPGEASEVQPSTKPIQLVPQLSSSTDHGPADSRAMEAPGTLPQKQPQTDRPGGLANRTQTGEIGYLNVAGAGC